MHEEDTALTMSIQGIHSCKCLVAAITGERTVVRMKLFMSLAVMLSSEPLATSRPLALERSLFIVRTHVAFKNLHKCHDETDMKMNYLSN
jgi:hypothetical protein